MTMGPIAKPGFWFFLGGVSRTLNISFLRTVPIGTTVRVNSRVVQAGRTMALIRSEIASVDGKLVYYTCEHHKVHVDTMEDHKALIRTMKLDKIRLEAASDAKL
jgi:acyl-coenzyme A thioesterase 13